MKLKVTAHHVNGNLYAIRLKAASVNVDTVIGYIHPLHRNETDGEWRFTQVRETESMSESAMAMQGRSVPPPRRNHVEVVAMHAAASYLNFFHSGSASNDDVTAQRTAS